MPTPPDNTTDGDARADVCAQDSLPLADPGKVNAQLAAEMLDRVGGSAGIADRLIRIMDEATCNTSKGAAPDYRTQLSAITLLLHYVLGKPIERQQVMVAKVGGEADMIDRLAQSPAARQAIKDMLAAADAADKNHP